MLEGELNQMANDNAMLLRTHNKTYILSIHSPFKMYWDALIAVATCYALVYIPANIAFGLSDTNRAMFDAQVAVDMLLVLDILLRFQTSYEDPSTHQEVFDVARLRRRYILRWFPLDFLGSVPSSFLGPDAYIRYPQLKVIRLCIVLRAVHMAQSTAFVTFMHWMSRHMNTSLLRLFLLGLLYLVTHHYIACGYYVMTLWETIDSKWDVPFVVNDSTVVKYVGSFYQALATTSGSTLFPKTAVEMHVTGTLLLLGIVINASIFGTCATLMKQVNLVADHQASQFDAIRTGLVAHHASEDLQTRVMHYYDTVLGEEKAHSATAHGLDKLPPKLHVQLTLSLHVTFLRKVPLFHTMDLDDIVCLVQGLERVVALPGEVIVRQGEDPVLYMIEAGMVDLVLTDPDMKSKPSQPRVVLNQLFAGDVFGSLDADSSPATVEVRALCFLQVLTRATFDAITAENSRLRAALLRTQLVVCRKTPLVAVAAKKWASNRKKEAKLSPLAAIMKDVRVKHMAHRLLRRQPHSMRSLVPVRRQSDDPTTIREREKAQMMLKMLKGTVQMDASAMQYVKHLTHVAAKRMAGARRIHRSILSETSKRVG
ncbi:hypothetical protein DYB25_008476 [Aphanomyces astaci]|uniref:Cyclic nucleotide-binding domain-containing protein n=1 Tax=Aphanomyces astaci TaxID=112090 RepID=A0A397BGZ2_APHAT|nr:hypothetical protein DYB25_008476 [Aphanomyces astaci]